MLQERRRQWPPAEQDIKPCAEVLLELIFRSLTGHANNEGTQKSTREMQKETKVYFSKDLELQRQNAKLQHVTSVFKIRVLEINMHPETR